MTKTTSRIIAAGSLVAVAIGCGLNIEGVASTDPQGGGRSPGDGGGILRTGDDGSTASGGPGAAFFDSGSAPDASQGDGATADAGTRAADAAVHDGGAGAIPLEAGPSHGTMFCPPDSDAAPCDLASNVCCTCPNCFAPYPTGCFPALTGCVGVVFSGVYARLTCGDSTNCAPGATCCAQFDTSSALLGSSCVSTCPSTAAASLCTTSAECASGTSCKPLAAASGFSACQ